MGIQDRRHAPETRIEIIEKAVKAASDVWAMGCILDRTAERATVDKKTAA